MIVELSQHEVNVIHSVLANHPLAKQVITDNNKNVMRADNLLTHLTLLTVLKKLPFEELTPEEYCAAYAEHKIIPSEDYVRALPPSTQV